MARKNSKEQTDTPTDHAPARRQGQTMVLTEREAAKEQFLEAFKKMGIVAMAVRETGIHRSTLYDWRRTDEEFRKAYDEANEEATDMLRVAAFRRGVFGVQRPIYQNGKKVGEETVYSDRLLELSLRARAPEFRERREIEHSGTLTFIDLVRSAMSEEDADSGQ